MNIGNFVLNDQKVREVRRRFYQKRQGNLPKGTFEYYLNGFSSDCTRFSHLALGLSQQRETIRQIYQKYFAGLFPGRRNGRIRVLVCNRKRRQEILRQQPSDPLLGEIYRRALENGLRFKGIPVLNCGLLVGINRRSVLINGRLCRILHCSNVVPTYKNAKNLYTHVQLVKGTLAKFQFLIIAQDIPGERKYFVLPTRLLVCKTVIYLPAEKLSDRKTHQRLDFKLYQDAWHLLK